MISPPSRGEVWLLDLNPIRGHEQAGQRPALVVSVDLFNHGPAGLATVLPLTGRQRNSKWHLPVRPPEGGVNTQSFIMTEQVRTVSLERFIRRYGLVTRERMAEIEDRLRILLDL